MVKTYLVTGGCGFIGSHLVDALLASGHTVRVLDDLSTGSRDNLSGAASLIVGTVADPDVVRDAMDGVDGCFHLAAIASVTRSTEAWFETHQVNLGGTINVFDAARQGSRSGSATKATPVIYASSAAIYGDNPALPLSEEAGLHPLTPYGADKAGSELHAQAGAAVFGVPNVGFRFFNIFGPRQDPSSPYSGVISIFTDRILSGLPITIFGDGGQTRDFVYVGDVVRALVAGMAQAEHAEAAAVPAPVLNVCTGEQISLLDLIQAIEDASGLTAEIQFADARAGDIRHSCGDPTGLQKTLDVVATTPLVDGLAALVDWRRQILAAA